MNQILFPLLIFFVDHLFFIFDKKFYGDILLRLNKTKYFIVHWNLPITDSSG